jgi:predicted Rossmann fold flavoprotein
VFLTIPPVNRKFHVLILGGGAAGLLCAIEAGKRGRRVAILEHADRIGKKILISGGGRCNFTNLHCQPENFISANPHFAKSALARYTPSDFIGLVEKYRISYHEKVSGQLFCDHAATEITDMLTAECRAAHVQVFPKCKIWEVQRSSEFVARTESGEFRAPILVVASGGLSIPKMGATGFGYDLARQFGLKIVTPRPALVPLTFNPKDRDDYCDLAGVSAQVVVSIRKESLKHSFAESMLITHRGLSGPAILQISSYWDGGQSIRVDLAPGCNVAEALRLSKARNMATMRSALQGILPNRFAARWLDLHAPANWANSSLEALEHQVHEWMVTPAATEGYEKAEVTAGGVDTDELSSKTMESCKIPGLFFIGEVVDVTGHLGGFNFQWAWASGAAAGRAV